MAEQKENQRIVIKKKSQLASIWHRFKKNKLALFGVVVFVSMLLVAVFADFIVDYEKDALMQNMAQRFQRPSGEHLFGTDNFGRDLFAHYFRRPDFFVCRGNHDRLSLIVARYRASAGYYGGRG